MLDMGFIRDIRKILDLLPARRQNLLFSATFSEDIRRLASGLLDQPATVQVTPRNTATELVTQLVLPVDRERKRELLSHLVRSGRVEQALVFTRTKHGANRLAEQLARDGIAATAIHGNKSQGQRVRALDDFKAGRATILVATEVASRGLDIEELPHVVNFELPMVAEDYVHRIGRTGRAGATGDAISLVCVDEWPLLREIEALLRHKVPTEVIPGFEPDRTIRPEPIRQRSQGGPGRPMGPRGGRPSFGAGRPNFSGGRPNLAAGRTDPGRPRPQHEAHRPGVGGGRPSGAPAHQGQSGPRRGPGPVGIGNAPGGYRGPRPSHGRPPQARPGGGRPAPMNHGGQQRPERPAALPGERLARHRDG
jgi:ATP-dependent RNA helicase RhlE